MTEWFVDGVRNDRVSIDSRGFQYGDGLFETVAIRDGQPRLWNLHMQRLHHGCDRLGLQMPSASECADTLHKALENRAFATAKIVVAAAAGKRGYLRATTATNTAIAVFDSLPLAPSLYRDGVDVRICETRLATGSPLAGLKTLNRLEQVLARAELEGHCFEGITRDADNHIICGTMSNLFVVRNKQLLTPRLEECGVNGVMRQFIIASLGATGHPVKIAEIDCLDSAEELFMSNSQFGVLPVRSCGEKHWEVGELTCKVMSVLADCGISECRV